MINSIDKAPAGATHRYEHGGLVSWYRETDSGLFIWRDGSWFASFFRSAQDLAQSCMLGRVEAIPAMPALQAEDDLTWLARNAHKWPDIVPGRAFAAAFVSDGSVRWLEYPPVDWDGCYHKHEWLARRAELQNKPSWKDAPEWAKYLSQNSIGLWTFTEFMAWPNDAGGWSMQDRKGRRLPIMVQTGEEGEVLGDWKFTQEKRPANLSEPAVTERMNEATDIEQKAAEAEMLAGKVSAMLRENPGLFSANELAELHQLCEAELTKRDAAVCGGEHRKKFVLVLGDGTFGLVIDNGLTWTHDLGRATIMSEKGWEQFKRFGKLAEVRHLHGKLVMRDGGES